MTEETQELAILTDSNFVSTIKDAGKPVLVDFYADWCGPCKMVSPIIDKLAQEYQGKILVAKLNIDQNQETTTKYGIMSIPTVILFSYVNEEIKIISSQTGFSGEGAYKEMIDQAIK